MKITDVKPCPVCCGPRNLMMVKVETDAGIYGWGEGGLSSRELSVAGAAKHYREWLIRGYLSAITNIGCIPYRPPSYHEEGDIAGRVDVENVTILARATLAAVVRIADCRVP
jgi:L-alanine-DL-glutamate epimerase-like enolase superfamily enzyme